MRKDPLSKCHPTPGVLEDTQPRKNQVRGQEVDFLERNTSAQSTRKGTSRQGSKSGGVQQERDELREAAKSL